MEGAYRNLGYFLLALPLVLVAGFWIPYIAEIPTFEPSITTPVHVHALLLFAWVGLLVVQPLTMRSAAFSAHRTLGRISYVLMPAVLIFSIAMLRKEYLENLSGGKSALQGLEAEYLSTFQLALLGTFYGLAVARIRKGDVAAHLRYMVCTAIILLPAGLARTLGYWFHVRQSSAQTVCFAVIDLCLVGLVVYDTNKRSAARPYIFALGAYLLIEAGWVILGRPV
jgi:uncharacterized membrane protein